MSYEIYRECTLGRTLTNSLDEMVQSKEMTPVMALRILLQFDKSMHRIISNEIRSRAIIKGRLSTYRFFDDVWTFVLKEVRLKIDEACVLLDNIKIVACNSKKE